MMAVKKAQKIKSKKCRICKTEYTPFLSTQKVCGTQCAYLLVKKDKEKKARKDLKEGRERLKTKSDHLNECQKAFNAYIRERDKNEPCISCGTEKPDIQYCAGHYLTRGGHPELRFSELNVHKQCNKNCNLQLSGNISGYRPRLLEKIGQSKLDWVEGPQQAQNWTVEDIKEMKKYFKERLKEIKE